MTTRERCAHLVPCETIRRTPRCAYCAGVRRAQKAAAKAAARGRVLVDASGVVMQPTDGRCAYVVEERTVTILGRTRVLRRTRRVAAEGQP